MIQSVQTPTSQQDKNWRIAFMVLSAVILIVMPLLSRCYGQSGDEWLQIIYGEHIWNYFFKGDMQALNYDNMSLQFKKQELYGGLFDFSMDVIHRLMPSVPILIVRHFFNALLGATMMVFTGLLARRLSGKWSVGVVALLFIIFSPRIFGESMNNPKDIPFACGFIVGIYYFVALLQDIPARLWKNVVGIALGFGLAFGVRSAGGILLLAYFFLFLALYYLLHKEWRTVLFADKNKLARKLVLALGVAIVGGYIIGLLAWPWGLEAPIDHPIESLEGMTNRETTLRVLFEGSYTASNAMPWYYEFKWLFISNPLVVMAGFIIFVLLSAKMNKQYGLFTVSLILFGALFTILYMIYKNSTVYDTWRHIFFVYPFWVIASAMGWDMLGSFIKDEKKKWIPTAVAIAGLLPAVVWTIRSHPNQYVYFNELEGGVRGAYGYYDLDYYQNSGKQAADWILKNIKPIPGKKILVRSNMSGFDKYFAKDTAWIESDYGRYTDRHYLNWDYYIAYPRYVSSKMMQEDKWTPGNAVHTVAIDGAPLCVIIKRKSTVGIEAQEALKKNDFLLAAQKYAEYIVSDPTDEFAYVNYGIALASIGKLDEAANALIKATQLDPERADFYKMLSQIYGAKGDNQKAEQAMRTYNEIMMDNGDIAD